jgi:hypothetical protein
VERWKHRPVGSSWGDFGVDDQRGRLNLLTPEKVRQGAAEVRAGLSFCLSLPLDYPGGSSLAPHRRPPVLRATLRNGCASLNYPFGRDDPGATDVVNDDLAILHLQYSTHWDGLGHIGCHFDADGDGEPEVVFYNGYRAGEHIDGDLDPALAGPGADFELGTTTRLHALGVQNMAETGVQGRAVLVDLHAHLGDRHEAIGYEQLMAVLEEDGVVIEPGDIVCLHTGFAQFLFDWGGHPDAGRLHSTCSALDGRDGRLLEWISSSKLAALVADNFGVEMVPPVSRVPGHAFLPLHEHCLFKLGVNLGELWYLTPVAAWLREHGRSRFLLTAPPLRLTGAIGSPTTPVATV